jgi:FtsZ-binding cell division protein ZapB
VEVEELLSKVKTDIKEERNFFMKQFFEKNTSLFSENTKLKLKQNDFNYDKFIVYFDNFIKKQRTFALEEEVKKTIENLTKENNTLNETLKNLKTNDKENTIKELTTKNDGLTNKIKELTTKNEELTTENEKLKTNDKDLKITQLTEENEKLTNDYNILVDGNEDNVGYNDLLDYQRENEPKLKNIPQLEGENKELKKDINTLNIKNKTLTEENTLLKNTINEVVKSFNYLRNKFMDIKEFLTPKEIIEQHKKDTQSNIRHHKQ